MDDRVRSLIVSTIVLLVILAIIGGVIFYIANLIRTRQSSSNIRSNSPRGTIVISSPSPSPASATTSLPGTSSTPSQPANTKTYTRLGFQIFYPSNWGLLTCNNSKNFELDPTNSQDELNTTCDFAKKPVTVLVGSNTCVGGQTADKGGVNFTKVVIQTSTGIDSKWCTKTAPALEFSHRVSNDGSRATSKQDFSAQIEEVISTLHFGASS